MACDIVVAAECLQLLHHRFPPCLCIIAIYGYRKGRVDSGCTVHFLCIGKICQGVGLCLSQCCCVNLVAVCSIFFCSLLAIYGRRSAALLDASLAWWQTVLLAAGTIFQVCINDIRWLGELDLLNKGSTSFEVAQLHLEERVEGGNLFSLCL